MKLEYQQVGFTKAINLFLSGVVILFSIFIFYLFKTQPDFADIRMLLAGIAVITGGIYFFITVLRSRIVIDGTRISVRNAFGERTADLSEIEGFRNTYGRYGKVGGNIIGAWLILKDGRGKIVISFLAVSVDDRFRDWLKQLPDLDKQD